MNEVTFFAGYLSERRIEQGPHDAVSVTRVQKVARTVAEKVLHSVDEGVFGMQAWLPRIGNAPWELKRKGFRKTSVGELWRRLLENSDFPARAHVHVAARKTSSGVAS